ncbi:M20/M25/M40 family metallo-hydrolase [Mycoplasmatota bacterium]|nr:M20/M25/M40 family metallo-hydrolase [Mycoplasmatota bacterium]
MIFLYIALAIIGILLLIAWIRFIWIKDRQSVTENKVDQNLALKYAKDLSKMIKIKTLSYDPKINNQETFIQLKAKMKSMFPNVFHVMDIKEFEGQPILLHWKGKKNHKPIVLMSHLDVVDVDAEKWDTDPFSGQIIDDEIFGRGTLDTKSTVFAFYQACEELIEQGYEPEQDVYLFSSTDEETSGPGASKAVDYLKSKNIKPFLVLDEGGAIVTHGLPTVKKPLAMVGIIEKGYANIKFSAKSSGGHSSTPPKNTPIARLSAFISDVEKHFPLKTKMIKEVENIFKVAAPHMKGYFRFLFGNMWLFKPLIVWLLPKISPYGRALLSTTIAFTMIKGSDQENVIPTNAYVIANLRTHPIQNVEQSFNALKKISEKYDIEAEILKSREASPLTDINGQAYTYLSQMISKVFPDVDTSPYVMLGGTDCRFFNQISDGALRFSPIRMDNSELSKMHGHNESIRITTLVEAVRFYQEVIKNNI